MTAEVKPAMPCYKDFLSSIHVWFWESLPSKCNIAQIVVRLGEKKEETIYRHSGNLPSIVQTASVMQMGYFLSKDGKWSLQEMLLPQLTIMRVKYLHIQWVVFILHLFIICISFEFCTRRGVSLQVWWVRYIVACCCHIRGVCKVKPSCIRNSLYSWCQWGHFSISSK